MICYYLISWLFLSNTPAKTPINHPLHLSTCTIYLNPSTHQLELVQSIFLEDLEQTLRQDLPKLNITQDHHSKAFEQALITYLQSHLLLNINQKNATWNYVGNEIQKAQLIIYMEIPKVKKLNTLRITSYVLNVFDDQKNWIHLNVNQQKQSILLTKTEATQTITY